MTDQKRRVKESGPPAAGRSAGVPSGNRGPHAGSSPAQAGLCPSYVGQILPLFTIDAELGHIESMAAAPRCRFPAPALRVQCAVIPKFAVTSLIAVLMTGCAAGSASHRGSSSPHADAKTRPDPALASFSPEEQERIAAVAPLVEEAAAKHRVDPSLIYAVIWVESRFDPSATSSAGARGLMQLMPATAAGLAKELGVARPRIADPHFNVSAGTYYLARLEKRFEGDTKLAIAAYHAGSGNVSKWQKAGQPHPAWSQDYVDKVLTAQKRFAGSKVAKATGNADASAAVLGPTSEPAAPLATSMAFPAVTGSTIFGERASIYQTAEIELEPPVFEPDIPFATPAAEQDDVEASTDVVPVDDGDEPQDEHEEGAFVPTQDGAHDEDGPRDDTGSGGDGPATDSKIQDTGGPQPQETFALPEL